MLITPMLIAASPRYDRKTDGVLAENLYNALLENIVTVRSTDVLNPHAPKKYAAR